MFTRRMLAITVLLTALTVTSCSSGAGESPPSSAPPSPSAQQSDPSGSASPSTSAADPPAPSAPAITIERPAEGETLSVPFTANGTADVFEATLTIDVVDESGFTSCVRHLTATSGSGSAGTWSGMLAFPPEEDALRATMRAYTFSPVDGSMANLVEFPITISPDRPRIILTSPRCGDVYAPGGPIQLLGTANLFEAALTVEVRDSSGTPRLQLPLTAAECCVESQFSSLTRLPADLAPGFYDVAAYSLSAADGSVEHEFVVQIEVRA